MCVCVYWLAVMCMCVCVNGLLGLFRILVQHMSRILSSVLSPGPHHTRSKASLDKKNISSSLVRLKLLMESAALVPVGASYLYS